MVVKPASLQMRSNARNTWSCAHVQLEVEAGVDVVPGTLTTHEILLTGAWHVRKRSEGRVVGESEELMKEGDIVILRDCFRVARGTSAACVHARPI